MNAGGRDRSRQPRPAADAPRGGAVRRLVRLRHACQPHRPGQGRLRTWRSRGRSCRRSGSSSRCKRNVTCADGTKMTASVVKQNLDFVGNPANKSPLLGLFMPIGATVTANNSERTVVVTTTTPQPVHDPGPRARADHLLEGARRTAASSPTATNGTGPYCAHRRGGRRPLHVPGAQGLHVGAERRHDRRRTGCPRRSTLKVITNETTAANLLLTRRAQPRVDRGAGPRAARTRPNLFKIVSPAQPNELFFNENAGHPAANPAVRKALVQALNLSQIGTVATSGRGLKMTQLSLQNFTPCAGNSVAGSRPVVQPRAPPSPALARRQHQAALPDRRRVCVRSGRRARAAAAVRGRRQGHARPARAPRRCRARSSAAGDWDIVLHRHRRREPGPVHVPPLRPDAAATAPTSPASPTRATGWRSRGRPVVSARRAASTGSTASGRSSRRPTSRRWPSPRRRATARA